MKRAAVLLVGVVLVFGVAPPAHAYTHFGASNSVSLSIQWSQALFGDGAAPTVILARSDSFPDSLAAGALAGSIGAPVLLNPPGGGLDDRLAVELNRLGTASVRIIGGTAAVSEQTVADLEAAGITVQRRAGENRIATAVAVMQGEYGEPTAVYLARAFGDGSSAFADSLGAGMLAGTNGTPLLLTTTESLSPETRAALAGVDLVVIVGGTAAVSPAVAQELRSMGIDVQRIAGVDRFETAAQIADESAVADQPLIALVDGFHASSWVSGYAASVAAGGAVVLANANELPAPTSTFLSSQDGGELFCAPEVGHDACLAAEALLND